VAEHLPGIHEAKRERMKEERKEGRKRERKKEGRKVERKKEEKKEGREKRERKGRDGKEGGREGGKKRNAKTNFSMIDKHPHSAGVVENDSSPLSLGQWLSTCAPCTSRVLSSWELTRNAGSWSRPDLLDQRDGVEPSSLQFSKSAWCFWCTLKGETNRLRQ
jgi:hypothetical protein